MVKIYAITNLIGLTQKQRNTRTAKTELRYNGGLVYYEMFQMNVLGDAHSTIN